MLKQSKKNVLTIPPNWIKESDEVYYTEDHVFTLTRDMLVFLVSTASNNARKQSRLCAHFDSSSSLHEMIIVHHKGNFIPPHKHLKKVESFHMIRGELAVVIFSEDGKISHVIYLSEKKDVYYRLRENVFHTVVPLSEYVIFHEVTNGPFIKGDMITSPWFLENDDRSILKYQNKLNTDIASFTG